MFVDASKQCKIGRAQNELRPEHIDDIHEWYQSHGDVQGSSRVASRKEVRKNDYNLNIPRYVEPMVKEKHLSVDEALTQLKVSLEAAYMAEERLKELLIREGLFK